MYADTGFFLMFMCCLLSGYGVFSSLGAAYLRHRRLYLSSKTAATVSGALCVIACVLLWMMFYSRDYSVAYIFKNSSDDLPAFYTLTAFWSSLEGSHLFWTLLLSLFSVIAHWTYTKDNEHIMPYVSAALQGVLCWMFYLGITYSDPFEKMMPVMENGRGMNALLQNFYMAFHPPSLFIGYTGLAIPFAYAIAALCFGDITEGWLRTVRRWTLFSWSFLTIGIFLGGRWAYVELGWGGYWAWDPVENSSFMPWLFATALLHSLQVQDKLGHLKRLSIVLAILAFWFSFFGTFITRSGIISSVHSFAQSPIGPNYLVYLVGVLVVAGILYIWKSPSILPSDNEKVWGFSRESALVITQFIILTFAVVILIGTVYPIISEALVGARFNIQAPYFNAFAPYIGLVMVVAIALGNLMRYQSGKLVGGKKLLVAASIVSLIPSMIFCYLGGVFESTGFNFAAQLVGIYLCFGSLICLLYDLYARLKTMKFKVGLFVKRNLSYTGAFLAHVGVLVSIVGFLGNYRGLDKVVTIEAGKSSELLGYEFGFEGIDTKQVKNATLFAGPLTIEKDGRNLGIVEAARSKYPTKPELLHEIGVHSRFWHDIYVVLSDFDKTAGKSATFHIYLIPTVRIVWWSAFLMVIGGFIALFDRYRGEKSRDVIGASYDIRSMPGREK